MRYSVVLSACLLLLVMVSIDESNALPTGTSGLPVHKRSAFPQRLQQRLQQRPRRPGDGGAGSIGIGDGCGELGSCGSTCCVRPGTPASDNVTRRCPGLQQFVAAAGGCVDCFFDPHPLCPSSGFSAVFRRPTVTG